MKPSILHTLLLCLCLTVIAGGIQAQSNILNRVERKVKNRTDRKIDQTIDKGLDEVEKEIDRGTKGGGNNAGKGSGNTPDTGSTAGNPGAASSGNTQTTQETPSPANSAGGGATSSPPEQTPVAWSKYDFVPGDKIIFQDDLAGEQNGEFPSRWDLVRGSVENADFGGENVIAYAQSFSDIKPLMKTASYLPEVFTLELDIYFHLYGNEAYTLNFQGLGEISIRANGATHKTFSGKTETQLKQAGWRHIAVSFNRRALKCYMDQDRVLNIPNIATPPTAFSVFALSHGASKDKPSMIRRIRLAEGGVKLYDRLSTDGRIVTHGISFEVGKSTIRPESAGTIREIVQLMEQHPELNFSVEGHTDADGSEALNQKLSEDRAAAVRNEMIRLGIAPGRLKTAGWGEQKPIDSNATAEGKANNRRVEFVRF